MTIEARVRSIIADQLGVSEEEIRPGPTLSKIWVQILWTLSNLSWRWKKSLKPKFLMKKQKTFARSVTPFHSFLRISKFN